MSVAAGGRGSRGGAEAASLTAPLAAAHTQQQRSELTHLLAASRNATPTMRAPSRQPSHSAASSGTSAAAAAAADRPAASPAPAWPAPPLNRTSSNADRRPGEACLGVAAGGEQQVG